MGSGELGYSRWGEASRLHASIQGGPASLGAMGPGARAADRTLPHPHGAGQPRRRGPRRGGAGWVGLSRLSARRSCRQSPCVPSQESGRKEVRPSIFPLGRLPWV